jgi:hypothetical protein
MTNAERQHVLKGNERSKDDWTRIERRILGAYRKFNASDLGDDPVYVRKEIRRMAYHEAGHAAALMFTGQADSQVTHVSIIPNRASGGRVRSKGDSTEFRLLYTPMTTENYAVRRSAALRLLLGLLAGKGAEMRIEAPDASAEFLDANTIWMQRNKEGSDLFRALQILDAVSQFWMKARRILKLAEKWTIEMLTLPEVWSTVDRLAGLLLARGKIDDFEEIIATCREIHGLSFRLPKWKRRLHRSGGRLAARPDPNQLLLPGL